MQRITLVPKKYALSLIPKIINTNSLCYYFSDDYNFLINLQEKLPDRIKLRSLSILFNQMFQEIKEPLIDLISKLNKKYDSPEWWGGLIASRSVGTTALFINVTYLFCAKRILSESSEDIIFIIDSQALGDCISNVATETGYHVVHYRRRTNKYIMIIRNWLYYAFRIFYFLRYSLQSRRVAFKLLKVLPSKKSHAKKRIVIRTMITKGTFDKSGKFKDRNFGLLPEWLRSKNYEVWTLSSFFNLSMAVQEVYALIKGQEQPFLIPDHYLKFSDYLGILYNNYRMLRRKFENIEIDKTDITPIFNEVVKKIGFSPTISILNLCYPMLKRLRERGFEIDSFYYPFENLDQEKLFILGCRKYFPNSKIIGFQHTTFFSNQLAHYLGTDEKEYYPLPDIIVCSGPIYVRLHKEARFPQKILVSGPNLRFEFVYLKRLDSRDNVYGKEKILLLPLTFSHDLAYELFIKVKDALKGLKGYKVWVRTHPLLSKEALIKFIDKIKLNDVEFADDGSIQDWLVRSHVVISAGASITIVESVVMGVPVIRVIPDNTIFYDPFFWPDYPLKPINTASEIRRQLKLIDDIMDKNKELFKKIGEMVLTEYFTKPTEENLKVFL